MLMSDAGGSTIVSNATLVFHPTSHDWPTPPELGPIPSSATTEYSICNYGEQEAHLETQPPYIAPPGPYIDTLDNLPFTDPNPNGTWQLYIYDDKTGATGVLQDSWCLEFYYP